MILISIDFFHCEIFYVIERIIGFEYILKIQQGEVNKLEFSKFSKLILSFFVRERIKITQTPNE